MSSLQYSLEYTEEECVEYTREQDEYYSIGNYDFDPSYEFDNGPKEMLDFHDDPYYNEHPNYYHLPFEPDDDYYSQHEEYDHFHHEEDCEAQDQQEQQTYDLEQWDESSQDQEDLDEGSYFEDWGDQLQSDYNHEFEELLHQQLQDKDSIQAQRQFEEFNQSQIQNHAHQKAVEYEYQQQQGYEQAQLQQNGLNNYRRMNGGFNHFSGQVNFSVQDHLPSGPVYKHDLHGIAHRKQKVQNKSNGKSSNIRDLHNTKKQGDIITTSYQNNFSHALPQFRNWGSTIVDNGIEIVTYPFNIALDIAEKIVSRIIQTGVEIAASPLKFTASKLQNLTQRVSREVRPNKINNKIVGLYREGYSKSVITELMNNGYEIIDSVLNEFYNTLSQNPPERTNTSPDNKKAIMKSDKGNHHTRSTEQLDNSPKSEDQTHHGDIEEDLIEEIINLLNQNLSSSQIAERLNLGINFLNDLIDKLNQNHIHKVESIEEFTE